MSNPVVPEKLVLLSWTAQIAPGVLDVDGLKAELSSLNMTAIEEEIIRAAGRGDDRYPGYHSHVTIGRGSENADDLAWWIELELWPGEAEVDASAQDASIDELMERIGKHLDKDVRSLSGALSSTFALPLESWEPKLPLPFAISSGLGQMPGSAKIAGVDLVFEGAESGDLLRAFITRYDETATLRVRLLSGFDAPIGAATYSSMLREALRHLDTFAGPKMSGSEEHAPANA